MAEALQRSSTVDPRLSTLMIGSDTVMRIFGLSSVVGSVHRERDTQTRFRPAFFLFPRNLMLTLYTVLIL